MCVCIYTNIDKLYTNIDKLYIYTAYNLYDISHTHCWEIKWEEGTHTGLLYWRKGREAIFSTITERKTQIDYSVAGRLQSIIVEIFCFNQISNYKV